MDLQIETDTRMLGEVKLKWLSGNYAMNKVKAFIKWSKLKAMSPTRVWMQLCISYISVYTPDLSYKLQGGSAN